MNRGALVHLQRSLRERGRIRLGISTPAVGRNGQPVKKPQKLDRFLFSAPDEATVALAAQLYGGAPEPWESGGRDRFRVISDADTIPVVFPTRMAFNQSYEVWANGFCTRRCDTVTCEEPGPGRKLVEGPCQCDPDERDCKLTTNLSVIPPELPGLGTWRLVSHGYYAATELAASVELIESALAAGVRVPARLFLERREVRRLIDGKAKVHKFVVPALDLDGLSVAALDAGPAAMGGTLQAPSRAALRAPGGAQGAPVALAPAGWRPVDQQALPPAPLTTVADALADNDREVKPRANAAPAIPRTGRAPRPAGAVDSGVCHLCGQEYGTGTLVKNPEPDGGKYVHKVCPTTAGTIADGPAEASPPSPPPGAGPSASDPAASQEQEADGRGGTSGGGDDPSAAEPAPAVAPSSPRETIGMTHNQHGHLMALTTEVFPPGEGMSSEEARTYQRDMVLGLADIIGQPGLTSRSELSTATASTLIDVLKGLQSDELAYTDGRLFNNLTGEPLHWEAGR